MTITESHIGKMPWLIQSLTVTRRHLVMAYDIVVLAILFVIRKTFPEHTDGLCRRHLSIAFIGAY